MIAEKGFNEAVITGGKLCSSFIKENLIDEVWIDLMPKILSDGIKLFEGEELDIALDLVELKRHNDNEILLKYKVRK